MTATYYHLHDTVNDIHYRNGGYIDPQEASLPSEDFEWVAGEAPEGSAVWYVKSLIEKMKAIYDAMDLPTRAAFYPIRASVDLALRYGDYDVAYALIDAVTVSVELEAAKQQLLDLIAGEMD